MPELAEVEFFRKRWDLAAAGSKVSGVKVHERAKIFRGMDASALPEALAGKTFTSSEAAAKQMLFRFGEDVWLGVHLGMTGELRAEKASYSPQRHDHLIIQTTRSTLVLTDPRMFGRVQLHLGTDAPTWWSSIAPSILSAAFTEKAVAAFLKRRARTPIKAVLLMQERFPGIGNWMADEILWRAAIHPKQPAGSLRPTEIKALWQECRTVCKQALIAIAGKGRSLPTDLNVNIPDSWLFHHRWSGGGVCPKTGKPLKREEVGGRTTCWSPARQKQH